MEQVEIAVRSLHVPSEPAARQQALHFLERFQNTVDAWNVSLNILSQASAAAELRFFAAQTLKHKVVADFAQLDSTMVASLRDTLLTLLTSGGESKRMRNQLDLALAALVAQGPVDQWASPVEELLSAEMLGVLACIPEQLANPLVHMSAAMRDSQMKRLLGIHVEQVISLVGQKLASHSANREELFNCQLAWIKYGAAGSSIVGSEILLGTTMQALLDDAIGESATIGASAEVVCELFFRLFQLSDAPSSQYLSVLVEGLARLKSQVLDKEDPDEDDMLAIGKVFLEAGEAFLPWLLEDSRAMQTIIGAAIILVENKSKDLKIVEATFNFWAALESRLTSANEATRAPFLPVFARIFRSLVVLHLAFPQNESSMTAEERDAFRDFRHVIGDCLKDCTRVMGSTEALLLVTELLRSVEKDSTWQSAEAVLFALRTISSSVERRESEAMPSIATTLLQIGAGATHPKLVYAVILNIGCYAEWARYHGEFVAPFLSLLAAHLQDQSSAACMALKYLCQSCATLMIPHEVTLRSLYCQAVGRLNARDLLDLTEAVAAVLAVSDPSSIVNWLPHYIQPWTPILQSADPAPALDNLAVFIEIIPTAQVGGLLGGLLPALPSLVSAFGGNNTVMESTTMLLKATIVHHPDHAESLIDLLDGMYSQHAVPAALYVLRYAVMAEPPILNWSRARQSVESAIISAERRLTNLNGAADLFQFLTSVLDYYDEFVSDSLISRTLAIARIVLSAEPSDPSEVSPTLLFLVHLLQRIGSPTQSIPADTTDALPICLHASLAAAVRIYPTNVLSDVAAVLRRYHHYNPAGSTALFTALLAALPDTLFLAREKGIWMEQYRAAMEAVRPREAKEMLIAFIGACRRRL
jgi:hypothetical protein